MICRVFFFLLYMIQSTILNAMTMITMYLDNDSPRILTSEIKKNVGIIIRF